MSQYPPPLPSDPPRQPSLAGPVLLTAIAAAIMFSLPSAMTAFSSESWCCPQFCCASTSAAVFGIMPVMMFRRSGGYLTAGTGCMIGLFGVGIGGLVGAIVHAAFPAYDVSELRSQLGEAYSQLVATYERQGQAVPVSREEFVGFGVKVAPYTVLLAVAFSSFLAGALGMLVAAMGQGRRPPPQWPQQPPQQGTPPQQPPPQPPQGPQPPQV